MAKSLFGSAPHQVPTNGMLGTLAFQDSEDVVLGDVVIQGVVRNPAFLSSALWTPVGVPTLRIADIGNGGAQGGLHIESYRPAIHLIDRSVNERSIKVELQAGQIFFAYDDGTANGVYTSTTSINPYAGSMTIGGSGSYNVGVYLRTNFPVDTATGTSLYGAYITPEFNENATSSGYSILSTPRVKDAPFTMTNLYAFTAGVPVIGAQATISQYDAFAALNPSDFSGTPSRVAAFRLRFNTSAANLNKWNLYGDGTAPSYLLGNLLLGSTTDTGNKLRVSGNAEVTARLYRGYSADLSVGFTSIAGVQNFATGNDAFINTSRWSNDNQPGGINIGKSRGTSIGTQAAVAAADSLGQINFAGSDGVGTSLYTAASIEALASEAFTTTARGTHLDFRTTLPGSTTRSVRMRLTDTGRVLVGTTTDNGKLLQVNGDSSFSGTAYFPAVGTAGAVQVTANIGGAWVDWNNARKFAVQIDAPDSASAYGGIRWTKWGTRHVAAIEAYDANGGEPQIVFHTGTQNNAWTFDKNGINRGAGGYVWGSWNIYPVARDWVRTAGFVSNDNKQPYFLRDSDGYLQRLVYNNTSNAVGLSWNGAGTADLYVDGSYQGGVVTTSNYLNWIPPKGGRVQWDSGLIEIGPIDSSYDLPAPYVAVGVRGGSGSATANYIFVRGVVLRNY